MAKFSDLPIEILMEVCDLLLRRGNTIEEAFARAHGKSTNVDEDTCIKSILQSGHGSVVALSQTSSRYRPLLRCLDRTLCLYQGSAIFHAAGLLKHIENKPEIAERVKIVYLNLSNLTSNTGPNEYVDRSSDNYLRQLAKNEGLSWPRSIWYGLPDLLGPNLQVTANTVARLLLGRLPNIEQLGLILPWTFVPYRNDPEKHRNGGIIHKRLRDLKHLAFRTTMRNNPSRSDRGVYQIFEDLSFTPTRVFLQDGFLSHMGIKPTVKTYSHLLQHVTHLVVGGQITRPFVESNILHIFDCCAPLQEFRYMVRSYKFDWETANPLAFFEGLKRKHATSLRTLAIQFHLGLLTTEEINPIDSFISFINLENLCIDGRCMKKPQIIQAGNDTVKIDGAITTLPRSLTRICFLDHSEDLTWFASHREALPKLKFVELGEVNRSTGSPWNRDHVDALVESGLKVSFSDCDAFEWKV